MSICGKPCCIGTVHHTKGKVLGTLFGSERRGVFSKLPFRKHAQVFLLPHVYLQAAARLGVAMCSAHALSVPGALEALLAGPERRTMLDAGERRLEAVLVKLYMW